MGEIPSLPAPAQPSSDVLECPKLSQKPGRRGCSALKRLLSRDAHPPRSPKRLRRCSPGALITGLRQPPGLLRGSSFNMCKITI